MFSFFNKSLFVSPLESFSVILEKNNIFDKIFLNIYICVFFIYLLTSFVCYSVKLEKTLKVSSILSYFINLLYNIFKDLIVNLRFERYFTIILANFILILFQNLGGFSLYEVSFNSHAVITIFLSFTIFFNIFVNILINFNELFYKKFVQKNLNFILTIILFIIELISFFVRPLSLGIRLFANILSGHILIHIFFNAFLMFYKLYFWFSLFLFLFCFFILNMEIFVAFIQSYIFFILSCIYLKDATELH